MSVTIKIKNSNVAGKQPDPSILETAELAVNLQDKKIYTKDTGNNIIELGGGHGPGSYNKKPTAAEGNDNDFVYVQASGSNTGTMWYKDSTKGWTNITDFDPASVTTVDQLDVPLSDRFSIFHGGDDQDDTILVRITGSSTKAYPLKLHFDQDGTPLDVTVNVTAGMDAAGFATALAAAITTAGETATATKDMVLLELADDITGLTFEYPTTDAGKLLAFDTAGNLNIPLRDFASEFIPEKHLVVDTTPAGIATVSKNGKIPKRLQKFTGDASIKLMVGAGEKFETLAEAFAFCTAYDFSEVHLKIVLMDGTYEIPADAVNNAQIVAKQFSIESDSYAPGSVFLQPPADKYTPITVIANHLVEVACIDFKNTGTDGTTPVIANEGIFLIENCSSVLFDSCTGNGINGPLSIIRDCGNIVIREVDWTCDAGAGRSSAFEINGPSNVWLEKPKFRNYLTTNNTSALTVRDNVVVFDIETDWGTCDYKVVYSANNIQAVLNLPLTQYVVAPDGSRCITVPAAVSAITTTPEANYYFTERIATPASDPTKDVGKLVTLGATGKFDSDFIDVIDGGTY